MSDFTSLTIPPVDFDHVGPAVGERFPDIVLPDQHGTMVDLHRHRKSRRAMIIFHRSADW